MHHSLSNRLSNMDEVLDIILEAIEICQKLTMEQPDTLNPDLAASLNTLWVWFSRVDIRWELAVERPTKFNLHLATYLPVSSHLIWILSYDNRMMLWMPPSRQLTYPGNWGQKTLQQIIHGLPDPFLISPLAYIIGIIKMKLPMQPKEQSRYCSSSRRIMIWRKLATERPAVFPPNLADPLSHALSLRLSKMGHEEQFSISCGHCLVD